MSYFIGANVLEPYIPNQEYWLRYYERLGTNEHPSFFQPERRFASAANATSKDKGDKPCIKFEMVSPAEQAVQQAASEIKRLSGKRKLPAQLRTSSSKKKRQRPMGSKKQDW